MRQWCGEHKAGGPFDVRRADNFTPAAAAVPTRGEQDTLCKDRCEVTFLISFFFIEFNKRLRLKKRNNGIKTSHFIPTIFDFSIIIFYTLNGNQYSLKILLLAKNLF